MSNFRLATATQNALADQIEERISANGGGGTIKFYDGEQPLDADAPIDEHTLLATLTFSDPAFEFASAGTIHAKALAQQNAVATGVCTWARVADAAGNTVFDCDVGVSDATINLNTTSIVINGPVVISSFTISVPRG